MTKRAVLAIWCSEDFQGTRADAIRLAKQGAGQVVDMFENTLFDLAEPEPTDTDHPDQLYLDF